MSKILNVEDMLDAAEESRLPGRENLQRNCEIAAQVLAEALARHLGIKTTGTAAHESGFGGLCAQFVPAHDEQPCPEVIEAGDPGGDWEMEEDSP